MDAGGRNSHQGDEALAPVVRRTIRLRVKRDSYAWLNAAANEVNLVWNYANETSEKAITRSDLSRKWLTGFDLCKLTAGSAAYFDRIGADVIQCVCVSYVHKRNTVKRQRLNWRVGSGPRRSLGWVPFKAVTIRRSFAGVKFCGKSFRVFERERLDGVTFRNGCFAQDACGDWWLCIPVDVAVSQDPAKQDSVGVDLGCKDAAVTSDNDRLRSGHYRRLESKIAQAQRRGHKRQAKLLHRRAARQRQDALHKFTTKLVREYGQIYIGDVSSTKLVKTRMAKSVLDAGWGMLRQQLAYKGQQAGRHVAIVDERYTTRACSQCGSLSGPQGLRQLVVRQWECEDCGAVHDRDVNSARNILAIGLRSRASVRGNESQVRAPIPVSRHDMNFS